MFELAYLQPSERTCGWPCPKSQTQILSYLLKHLENLLMVLYNDKSIITELMTGFSPVDEIGREPQQVCTMYEWPFELTVLPSFYLKPQHDSAFLRLLSAFAYAVPSMRTCPLLPVLV